VLEVRQDAKYYEQRKEAFQASAFMKEPLGIFDMHETVDSLRKSSDIRKNVMAQLIEEEGTAIWIPRFVNWLFEEYDVMVKSYPDDYKNRDS